ncbi:hypothetical protein [Mesorhizobium neociceri]|uniref:GAF domain-containing protein n=1 Tax=Mesorhizobium neociceri TaxID=1307853 RepID=A0A838B5F4_9HYPH|nr:hypothetical protein [Mesorhizobium neociceri]MBA1140670.1 hypothetical protein [Mesorhizobium neociceri]
MPKALATSQDSQPIELWLSDGYGRGYRFKRYAWGFYYNRIPRGFRVIGMTHWLAKTGLASSAPAVAFFYGSVGAATAAVTAAAIFLANSVVTVLDRLSQEKSSGTGQAQTELMVRLGDLLTGMKGGRAVGQADRDDAIRACLGILENYARLVTRSKKGDISVSLVLFAGNSTTRMKVRHRNPGNERPTNREFDATHLMGFHACKRGTEPRVVHDLKKFGGKSMVSPTQTTVNYRSIFMIPVVTRRGEADEKIRGFISIDSPRPYAFYGNRSSVLVVTCEPVLSRINELI